MQCTPKAIHAANLIEKEDRKIENNGAFCNINGG